MKILQVIDRLNAGGAERVCVTLATLFQHHGHDVTVLELLSEGVLKKQLPSEVSTIQLNRKSRLDLKALFHLMMQLKKYDVIHVHMRHVYRYVFLANLFVRKKLIFHDHFNQYATDWFHRSLFKCMLKRNIYVSVEQTGCEWALHNLRLKSGNVYKLPNIILKVKTSETIRNAKLVLLSNIKPEKNIEFIVPLVKSLSLRKKDVHIDIIGNIQDEQYFNSIVKQLKEYGLNSHITFHTNVSDVQSLLSKYALGLHFSKRESGPLVLLEYLAQELPFISFLTGEIAHKLQIDLPDFFVKDFNEQNWCDSIINKLAIKSYAPSLDTIFKKHNDTNQYYNKCLTIYQSIAS